MAVSTVPFLLSLLCWLVSGQIGQFNNVKLLQKDVGSCNPQTSRSESSDDILFRPVNSFIPLVCLLIVDGLDSPSAPDYVPISFSLDSTPNSLISGHKGKGSDNQR